ncbi:hypothetical protein LTR09_000427 [Extremus antarcticus]|uniref:3-hydroxyacyl-CoA dehydrogenase n=1 Tax=Extremus antarcticus TaxID=702011 RepID=A0AAJ0GJM1_9PEZI|nr:hypothetical protein LTR09_000427 [Extremus antarcticus]
MTYQFHPGSPSPLKDSVVVLTGGALGVGASLVRLLHSAGAHVFFGDILSEPGLALEEELSANSNSYIKFIPCDVTSYSDNLALFDAALQTCGRIDHAVANAGLGEQLGMFDPELTLETVRQEPKKAMSTVDVNLKGVLYFANIASVYLRQGEGGGDRSLTLLSSVAGFREDPGLNVYVAAKHGVLGLMRVLRELLIQPPFKIRTNAISPWMTKTRLTAAIEPTWEKAGLPANTAEDVAKVILGVMADGKVYGGTMYIEGGRAWNIEAGLMALKPQWIGEKQNSDLDKGTLLMGSGEHWTEGNK